MPSTPADTDPFTMMAAAAEHVRSGVPEVELEWWADSDEGDQRRMTVWLRATTRNEVIASAGLRIERVDGTVVADHPAGSAPMVVPPEWSRPDG